MKPAGRAFLSVIFGALSALILHINTLFQAKPIESSSLVTTIIVATFVGYVWTCITALNLKRANLQIAGFFIVVSLIWLAAIVTGFATIYRHTGLIPPESDRPNWSEKAGPADKSVATAAPAAPETAITSENATAKDKPIVTTPSAALYFSIITWTTVGYGDFQPTSDSRPFAAFEALSGLIFMGLFIATLAHVGTNFSSEVGRGP